MRELLGGTLTAVIVFLGILALVFGVAFAGLVWTVAIEPRREAGDLYRAADEARALPYVSRAKVHIDWFDGNALDVYLTPKVTNGEVKHLWCDVLLGIEGGWVTVHRGYWNTVPAPKRKQCLDPSPSPQVTGE